MADYYISESGDDSTGAGTSVSMWRSFQKAYNVARLVPGSHTVYVAPGAYGESACLDLTAAQTCDLVKFFGTSGILSDVVLTGGSTNRTVQWDSGNVTFQNITIDAASAATYAVLCYATAGTCTLNNVAINAAKAGSYGIWAADYASTRTIAMTDGSIHAVAYCARMINGSALTFNGTHLHIATVAEGGLFPVRVQSSAGRTMGVVEVYNCEFVSPPTVDMIALDPVTEIGRVTVQKCRGTGVGQLFDILELVHTVEVVDNVFSVDYNGSAFLKIGKETTGGTLVTNANPIAHITITGNRFSFTGTNITHQIALAIGANGAVVTRNRIIAPNQTVAYTFVLKADNCTITHNVIQGGSPAMLVSGASGNTITHNTFVGVKTTDEALQVRSNQNHSVDAAYGRSVGNTIRDNILVSPTGYALDYDPEGLAGSENWANVLDYNLLDSGGTYAALIGNSAVAMSGGIAAVRDKWAATYAGKEEADNDAHSLCADPLLNANLSVLPGSPAFRAASDGKQIGVLPAHRASGHLLGVM